MANYDEPDFDSKNVQQLFTSGFYKVPRYQREYAWSSLQIGELLNDLDEFFESNDAYYLLGQIVLVDSDEGSQRLSEVVDGQQRLTSLFLLLSAIATDLKKTIDAANPADEDMLQTFSEIRKMLEAKRSKKDPKQIRLVPANNAEAFLQSILEGAVPEDDFASSNTEVNLKSNYETISKYLQGEKYCDSDTLWNFSQRLLSDVYVVCLTVQNHEQALAVFEKMNDRGMPLNSADLLKNLLFANTSTDDYEILSEYWSVAADNIFKISSPKSAASMEFLLKAFLASTTGKSVPKRQVYKQWKEYLDGNPEEIGTFGVRLQTKAQALNKLSRRWNTNEKLNNELFGTWFFETSQQFTVLLAGDELNPVAFQELSKVVDARFMLSSFSNERTQALEVVLSPWAKAIADLPRNASVEDVRMCSPWVSDDNENDRTKAMIQMTELFESARRVFGNMSYRSSSDRKRMKYVLARVAVYVEGLANNDVDGLWDRILRKKGQRPTKPFDLEHVTPRSSSYKSSSGSDVDWIDSIGNLVPLVPIDNTSAGKMSPLEKKSHYNSSELIITKSLCSQEDFGIGFNKRVQAAMGKIHGANPPKLENWSKDSASIREEMYWTFFKDDLLQSLNLKEEEIDGVNRIIPQ